MKNMHPEIFISDKWDDYELIDCGDTNRLERWGEFTLVRPDPQALWPKSSHRGWREPDAVYHRSSSGGGAWDIIRKLPESWHVRYGDFTFKVRPTNFKHMGLFPEQAFNWDKIFYALSGKANAEVLNLFGYTGAASIAAAAAGANVCHVDSSKGVLGWCRENAAASRVPDGRIRLIPEDCLKFVQREERRGRRYDAVIMDPPSFGRGLKGEVWKLEDDLWALMRGCRSLFTPKPLFFLINSYTAGLSPVVIANMMESLELPAPKITFGELALPFRRNERLAPCGISCWAEFNG